MRKKENGSEKYKVKIRVGKGLKVFTGPTIFLKKRGQKVQNDQFL